MDQTQKINKDYYNKNAQKWAALKTNSFYQETSFRKFVEYFKNGDSILDIGCGWGIHAPLFLGIGRKLLYEGLDISEEMIRIAQSRFPQLNFSVGNILDKETLSKRKFNGFWAGAVLIHIPQKDWSQLLDNLKNLTVKSGVGFLTLLNDKFEQDADDSRHFTFISDEEFKTIINSMGWKILEQGELPKTPQNRSWRWYIIKLL